jgi:hypothetical protein
MSDKITLDYHWLTYSVYQEWSFKLKDSLWTCDRVWVEENKL